MLFFWELIKTIFFMAIVVLMCYGMDNFFANMSGSTVINWSDPVHSVGLFGWIMFILVFVIIFIIVHYINE